MKISLYNIVIEAIIMIALLFWPQQESPSQKPIPKYISVPIRDTQPKPLTTDSIAILDSIYFDKLIKNDKASKKLLNTELPKLTKADKELDKRFVKLEKYLNKEDTKEEATQPIKTKKPRRYTIKNKAALNPVDTAIIIPPVVKEKTFWQKVKSIFKSKNKKDGKDTL